MIDLVVGTQRRATRSTRRPATASPASTLLFPDVLRFTATGSRLIFDALNELPLPGGGSQQTLEHLRARARDRRRARRRAAALRRDLRLPRARRRPATTSSRSTRSTRRPTSRPSTPGTWCTGDFAAIDTVAGFEGVPSFTGDDLALVYAQPAANATGASLFRRPLAADHLNPAGPRTSWLANALLRRDLPARRVHRPAARTSTWTGSATRSTTAATRRTPRQDRTRHRTGSATPASAAIWARTGRSRTPT